ncbi:hypothetical protein QVD17_37120 [Tagetes erecta]|uniref:Uncharacterized protein n=1 Tax=Tagetes erecta TaxID=13708 RepID=A0AAD8NJS5_TARER|nr:hypothetical protein QVD17_37120 [Tagetes erecta]
MLVAHGAGYACDGDLYAPACDDVLHDHACDGGLHAYAYACVCAHVRVLEQELVLVHLLVTLMNRQTQAQLHHLRRYLILNLVLLFPPICISSVSPLLLENKQHRHNGGFDPSTAGHHLEYTSDTLLQSIKRRPIRFVPLKLSGHWIGCLLYSMKNDGEHYQLHAFLNKILIWRTWK